MEHERERRIYTMRLNRARLCLDCEEVYEGAHCPTCASETFAYLTQWVPAQEGRVRRRKVRSSAPRIPKTVAYGIGGAALAGLLRWVMKGRARFEKAALDREMGELK